MLRDAHRSWRRPLLLHYIAYVWSSTLIVEYSRRKKSLTSHGPQGILADRSRFDGRRQGISPAILQRTKLSTTTAIRLSSSGTNSVRGNKRRTGSSCSKKLVVNSANCARLCRPKQIAAKSTSRRRPTLRFDVRRHWCCFKTVRTTTALHPLLTRTPSTDLHTK